MKQLSNDTDLVKGIEAWFRAQCDGDWEHNHGFSIETTDNPGWYVEVDLTDTAWADHVMPFSRDTRRDFDWIQFEVRGGKFIGSGGVSNLSEILRRFVSIVTASEK